MNQIIKRLSKTTGVRHGRRGPRNTTCGGADTDDAPGAGDDPQRFNTNGVIQIARRLLGRHAITATPLGVSHNALYRVEADGNAYVLKRFPPDGLRAEREQTIGEHLRIADPRLSPELVAVAREEHGVYHLQRLIEGVPLADIWSENPRRVRDDLDPLGRFLAYLHSVALPAEGLEPEQTLFSRRYFDKMRRIAASAIGGPATGHREGQSETARGRSFEARSGAACEPDVGDGGLEQALELCYRRVTEGIRSLPEVIVHGDYGAHQIIVDRSGDWHLVDYEFAVRGPFADDVGGCEARLLRRGIRDRECFLCGYAKVAGSVEGYAAFRAAFMAYNLLAMLTYGSSATPRDWSLLQELLGKRETE